MIVGKQCMKSWEIQLNKRVMCMWDKWQWRL